ncbi:energy transducer TonB [Cellvibrio sp. KY-YJ-3]|uniref:energy transducer TonB n=1 Tax=Cellvibrio sp. KY-YJ-3 TaxID=454662 RepID=UPI0012441DD6|nr:energy transducer TonB [Cellvibrio sp. KY-YJ-3]QEY13593.1 hypothetical protein D0B88_15865 [Cellvibrio sp. KY-YJ-3]
MPKKNITLYLLILLTSIATHFAHADFNKGMDHYVKGEYEFAFKEFMSVAQYGDHDAQQNIGAMYFRGEHVEKNTIEAYAWFALAAQDPTINQNKIHLKILKQLNETQQSAAKKRYESLLDEYANDVVIAKLTPKFIGKNAGFKERRAIKKVAPQYPTDMLRQGKAGFVDVIFTVDKYGFTRDHMVYYSPSQSFTDAAIAALRKFQYEPAKIDGKPIDINGYKTRHNFYIDGHRINNEKLGNIVDDLRKKAKVGNSSDQLAYAYFLEAIPSFTSDFELTDNPNEWYMQSAKNGNGAASYFLGRNILYGNMCEQDTNQSMAWLLKAAKQGIPEAQYMLALESFSGAHFAKDEKKGFYWLEQAAARNNQAKVRLAWILATHPDATKRNGKVGESHVNQVPDDYLDKQNYFQTKAAIAAENGDFKSAIKWQKKAVKDAKKLELPLEIIEQRLASYSTKKPWREEI